MSKFIHSPTLNTDPLTLKVVQGGTTNIKAAPAAEAIGLLTNNMLGQPNGVVQLDASGNIPASNVGGGVISSSTTLDFIAVVQVNSVTTFQITNYDSFTTYIVSATNGTVSMSGDLITYTAPGSAVMDTIDINGIVYNITVEASNLVTPTILTPPTGSVGVGPSLNVVSDPIALQGGTQIAKLLASDGAASDNFGRSVSISSDGLTVVSGAFLDDDNGTSSGSAYIYKYNGTTWVETKIIASDGAGYDYFGWSVSISVDGLTVVAGAIYDDDNGTDSGSAYIYKYDGTSWIETKLLASDGAADDQFGRSVSVSGDGLTAVVGASGDDDNGINSGSAYIYKYNGTTWVETKLTASDGAANDVFGGSVSISSDGLTVVSGAYGDDTANGVDSGSAYIYKFDGTNWIETKLTASDGAANDVFGGSVSISSDGLTVVVGASGDDDNGNISGSAYIYKFDGTNWIETKLLASDGADSDVFGGSVSISSDGLTVVVGATGDYDITGGQSGSIYIYKYNGATWIETKLLASDRAGSDFFGCSVSISSDGLTVVSGAYGDDTANGVDSGSAYIFKPVHHLSTQYQVASDTNFTNIVQDNIVPGTTNHDITGLVTSTTYHVRLRYISVNYGTSDWSNVVQFTTANSFIPNNELAKISASDGAANDVFGGSVSISSDGLTVVVGAYGEDDNGTDSGSAYIYKYDGTSWVETKILANDGAANDQFGRSVSVSGDGLTVVVGSYQDDDNGAQSGSIYVYKYNGTTWVETKIVASDGATNDRFGSSVSISSDGLTVVAGAYGDATTSGAIAGSIYIYKYNGSTWVETNIIASDGAGGDQFGNSIAVSSDGLTVVVGAYLDDTTNGTGSGSAYIYKYNGTTWIETKLLASDGAVNDYFGSSVSISSDGLTVVVGSYLDIALNGTYAGSAYIYKYDGTTWVETKIIASDGAGSDLFGWSVSISSDGSTIVVGAYGDDDNGTGSGSAYIFGQ